MFIARLNDLKRRRDDGTLSEESFGQAKKLFLRFSITPDNTAGNNAPVGSPEQTQSESQKNISPWEMVLRLEASSELTPWAV